MTGTNNNGTPIPKHGANLIDGMLFGAKWAETTINYTFTTSTTNYGSGYQASAVRTFELPTFSQVTQGTKDAARFALEGTKWVGAKGFSVEGFTNLNVTEVAAPTGVSGSHIRYGQTAMTGSNEGGYASFPGTAPITRSGDVWLNDGMYSDVRAGTIGWYNVIHETGHALGLKHPGSTFNTAPYNPALNPAYDAMEYTVMSYNSYPGEGASGVGGNDIFDYAQTFMMLDIRALQHAYGADFTTNSGNTTYRWLPGDGNTYVNNAVGIDAAGDTIFATIWDGGGIDTYDLAAYTTDMIIRLTPGDRSTFDTSQLAVLNRTFFGTPNKFATGNIYNALQYGTDARSLIENANGGSGSDALVGNSVSNTLRGNAGADAFNGLGGNDHYYGGTGADSFLFINSTNSSDGRDGRDTVWDFNDPAGDVIYLRGSTTLTNYSSVQARLVQVGTDVELRDTDGDVLVIKNVIKANLGLDDFVF